MSLGKVVSFPGGRPWRPRKESRSSTCLQGFLELSTSRSVACVIRDLSIGGAKVLPGGSVPIDEVCALAVPLLGVTLPVTLIWRQGFVLGLAFTTTPDRL
jgi:hypothetical protein